MHRHRLFEHHSTFPRPPELPGECYRSGVQLEVLGSGPGNAIKVLEQLVVGIRLKVNRAQIQQTFIPPGVEVKNVLISTHRKVAPSSLEIPTKGSCWNLFAADEQNKLLEAPIAITC